MKLFNKILIANRSEIVVRIIKSARLLGIKTVAVFSEIEREALYVKMADEAYSLGNGELKDTYLNIDKILEIAIQAECDAIHPGYGFLAENSLFVEACIKANITFIGPLADTMRVMGNKISAREFIHKINIPTTKGITGDLETLKKASFQIPFPVLIKAAAGGGGKGMRIVRNQSELNDALESTSREALTYFGDGSIYIEQYIEKPRHIEIQILGDNHGNVVHLFERECSIQRRYQKVIEESPSPTLTDDVRMQMGEAAVKIGQQIGYTNAGTIEFLVDNKLNFYFLEMNTRVQVEHPVTEMVTGIDIVKEQILIAAGNSLSFKQNEVRQSGHAIECRIYAEDPEMNFMPAPGKMTLYREPVGDHIRIDTGIEKPTTIESFFDPMIGKLIVWGENRDIAIYKSVQALNQYIIQGIKTNISFLASILQSSQFQSNTISTHFCEDNLQNLLASAKEQKEKWPKSVIIAGYIVKSLNKNRLNGSVWNSIGYWRDIMNLKVIVDTTEFNVQIHKFKPQYIELEINAEHVVIENWQINDGEIALTINKSVYNIYVSFENESHAHLTYKGCNFKVHRPDLLIPEDIFSGTSFGNGEDANHIYSPMPGKIIKINVSEGEMVVKGSNLLIMEAMKMENQIKAPRDAVIAKINVKLNDTVASNKPLMDFE